MTRRALAIDALGNVEEMSGREFFTRAFGHPPRTQAEKLSAWNAEVERYVELLAQGCQLSSYGNPQVAEAKRRFAERLKTETAEIRARTEAMKAKIDRRRAA